MRDHRNLEVWGIALEISKKVYLLTGKFPKSEIYGLTSQMRRAGVSIASNISEGCGYDSNKDFIRYLRISMGSIKELETQFYIAFDVGYILENDFESIIEDLNKLGRKLWSYIKYLNENEDRFL